MGPMTKTMSGKNMHITLAQLRWHRLMRSGLITPFASAEDCAEALIGVQAQMSRAAALAIAARIAGDFSFRQFEELLYGQRSLVRTWGQRNTLHTFRSADWPNLVAALGSRRSWAHGKFLENGGSAADCERLIAAIGKTLQGRPPLTREAIAGQTGMESSGWGGLLIDAAYRGLLCDAGARRFAHGMHWLPRRMEQPDPKTASIALMRRYLRNYGPARPADAAFWFGEKVAVVKQWLASLDLIEVVCEKTPLVALREDKNELTSLAPPRSTQGWPIVMLYRFDPLLLAHKGKDWIVPPQHYGKVWTAGGHVSGVILQKGVAVATWQYQKSAGQYGITLAPFTKTKISQRIQKKVEQQEKFLGKFFPQ